MKDTQDVMESLPTPEEAQDPVVNELRATISGKSDVGAVHKQKKACLSCSRRFVPVVAKQEFCSGRCRLLYWAAKEIIKELGRNRAAGLQKVLRDHLL